MGSVISLLIPDSFRYAKKLFFPPKISPQIGGSCISDVAINVLGYVPFGFFLHLWLSKARQWNLCYACVIVITVEIFTSLTIEILQVNLPAREYSMTDLICNTLGTIVGVVVFNKILNMSGSSQLIALIWFKGA